MKRCALLAIPSRWLALALGFAAAPQASPPTPVTLDAVLKKMDAAAASFHTTQADFVWDSYEKVIDEIDTIQTGTVYYRRSGKEIEMMADVKMAEAISRS